MIGERRIIEMSDLDLILAYVHAGGFSTDAHSDQLRFFAHASDESREVMRRDMVTRIRTWRGWW